MTNAYSEQRRLRTDEKYHSRSAARLNAALQRGDIAAFLESLNVLLRAQGFAAISRKTGLNRTWLYKALSPESNPGIHATTLLLSAPGFRLCVKRLAKRPEKRRHVLHDATPHGPQQG